ncbi:MAG: hypothetical protein N4A45_07075 [Flavobacteriales bacterium]|jgi:hypothetical protein|nr:hypothetical protein [Flavobacteriales bacterium]
MEGEITKIEKETGMIYVSTDSGDSIFEMISDDNLSVGDKLYWREHNPFGDCMVTNLTTGEKIGVYFQDH